MTEPPNILPPRDPELADYALRLFLMNLPGWPPSGRGGANHARESIVWPTLKSYQWMREFEAGHE